MTAVQLPERYLIRKVLRYARTGETVYASLSALVTDDEGRAYIDLSTPCSTQMEAGCVLPLQRTEEGFVVDLTGLGRSILIGGYYGPADAYLPVVQLLGVEN